MKSSVRPLLATLAAVVLCAPVGAQEVSNGPDLRLVPYPKKVSFEPGNFGLKRRLILEVSQAQAAVLGEQLTQELQWAGYPAPTIRPLKTANHVLRLSTRPRRAIKKLPLREIAGAEEYSLQVQANAVTVCAAGAPGLYYGAQTLRQLIRANRQEDGLPVVTITDWPALGWRGFQDDLTRGPSSTLANLEGQVVLGSFLKLNLFTYYMEHQFAFKKHPEIGPKGGSLTPEELKSLVGYSRPRHVQVLGNQQSFGHFGAILAHPEYASLRETPNLLCPTNPRTYELLNDLYAEVVPLLTFPYFNVCCDETDGLGEGPSKELAAKIGTGGVYVEHIRRVHDLLQKYDKRMMMWGDIILRHPDQLSKVPKDTVMMTWGYDARASFDEQITPFAKAGYEFFVCPGVSCWNRLLPDFATAATNIQHFVRDGLKQGTSGMLNTAWDDDGESLNAPNWYGFAWGAECAWTGSTTCPADFDRRLGAVLFGNKGDQFGRAIQNLSVPGVGGLPSATLWQFSFGAVKVRQPEPARAGWNKLLTSVHAAIENLEACRSDAKVNGELLDFFLFGAHKIELCFQRELDRLDAALTYRQARRVPLAQALPLLEQLEKTLRGNRDTTQTLALRFAELWRRENREYALDRTTQRYQELIRKYDVELERLAQIRLAAKPDRSLPTPREAGLELIEEGR
ncbi:MAG: glycoside hydrolase family 20 zincin-like fold domain-containing protein [Verrucomicrobiota bacterium]